MQLINLMDQLWRREGLDLHMLTFKIFPTGRSRRAASRCVFAKQPFCSLPCHLTRSKHDPETLCCGPTMPHLTLHSFYPSDRNAGLIELVPNAKTLREIHTLEGVTGSFNDKVLHKWLRNNNPSAEQWRQARSIFTASVSTLEHVSLDFFRRIPTLMLFAVSPSYSVPVIVWPPTFSVYATAIMTTSW